MDMAITMDINVKSVDLDMELRYGFVILYAQQLCRQRPIADSNHITESQ